VRPMHLSRAQARERERTGRELRPQDRPADSHSRHGKRSPLSRRQHKTDTSSLTDSPEPPAYNLLVLNSRRSKQKPFSTEG
jgi:hypothetical protein